MGVLSNICDCTHKDPRTEINMFLTQNQTIQFSSPLENLKASKKEPLTYRSGSSTNDYSRQKNYDFNYPRNINAKLLKMKNDKKNQNIIYNNKLLKKKGKQSNKYLIAQSNNNNIQSFNSNFSYCSNNSIASKITEIIKLRGNSEIYIGEKLGKKKHGLGLQIWNKDTFYFGIFKDNKANGVGKFISGKTKYKGEFKNDEENGFGIYSNNNLTYEGLWNNDVQSDYGIEKWDDGSVYRGQYYDGKKNGIGIYMWGDGKKYEGEFVNNTFQGYGIYYFNNNNNYYYIGQWKNNKKNGYGEMISEDKIFIGYYLNDKRNGFGISFIKSKKKYYIGFWKEGKKIGLAKIFLDNKKIYGIVDKDEKFIKIKDDENEFYNILEKEGFLKYKNLFKLSLEDIANMINKTVFNNNLLHQ